MNVGGYDCSLQISESFLYRRGTRRILYFDSKDRNSINRLKSLGIRFRLYIKVKFLTVRVVSGSQVATWHARGLQTRLLVICKWLLYWSRGWTRCPLTQLYHRDRIDLRGYLVKSCEIILFWCFVLLKCTIKNYKKTEV